MISFLELAFMTVTQLGRNWPSGSSYRLVLACRTGHCTHSLGEMICLIIVLEIASKKPWFSTASTSTSTQEVDRWTEDSRRAFVETRSHLSTVFGNCRAITWASVDAIVCRLKLNQELSSTGHYPHVVLSYYVWGSSYLGRPATHPMLPSLHASFGC